MNIHDHFTRMEERLNAFPLTVSSGLEIERIDIDKGYMKSKTIFADGSELHLFQFVEIKDEQPMIEKYRYHYQDENGALIKRWDNAKHHPEIDTFPDHIHVGGEIKNSSRPDIEGLLAEITNHIRYRDRNSFS